MYALKLNASSDQNMRDADPSIKHGESFRSIY